jgi:hypothetical protein
MSQNRKNQGKKSRPESREQIRKRPNYMKNMLQRQLGGETPVFHVKIVEMNGSRNLETNPVKVTPNEIKTDIFEGSKIPRISKKNIQLRNNSKGERNEELEKILSTERIVRVGRLLY